MTPQDTKWMEQAIQEAKKCPGEPGKITPSVGAVVVTRKGDITTGFRGENKAGCHAEYVALDLKLAKGQAAGATVYTTLEPCTLRSPEKVPCARRLINRKVARVVIGMLDPNQNICGRGIRMLRDAGVIVDLFPADLMATVEEQNREFAAEQERITAVIGLGLPAINPFYSRDLEALDAHFEVRTVLRRETVLIVTGTGIVSELLDRHAAALLRDAINIRSARSDRRAMIVSAHAMITEPRLKQCANPVISIGGEVANAYTKVIQEAAQSAGRRPWKVRRFHGIYCGNPPRAALWGQFAQDTFDSVVHYINHQRGINEFLANCWGR